MNQNNSMWMRLDNAGKIYPAAKRRNWINIFRLSVTLDQPIDPEILQKALEVTIKRFPSIAVKLKHGLFWYYLEAIDSPPQVVPDAACPCTPMLLSDIRTCAFRVLYYKNRIAVELFHALTDGSGGLIFIKTLAAEYLSQKNSMKISSSHGVLSRNEAPKDEELEDSFLKYAGHATESRREPIAYMIPGEQDGDSYLNVITGILDSKSVIAVAKSHGVSLTTLLTSVMIQAIIEIQNVHVPRKKNQKPVKILIPVNLRQYFDSKTLRNFAFYITPGIDPRLGQFSFEDILKSVHHQMGNELHINRLTAKFTTNVKAEKALALKIMPLFMKNLAMKFVYNMVGEKISSISISNLGKVEIPDEMEGLVRRFDFILGMQKVVPYNCSVLSYDEHLYITFSRKVKEAELERKFFTHLRKLGLHVLIESNQKTPQ